MDRALTLICSSLLWFNPGDAVQFKIWGAWVTMVEAALHDSP